MKKTQTRRALLMSALSLLLCVSMLVGTTFAWFTDSVTSGRNTIQTGNLDVVLEYWDGDSYEEVTSTTKLFDDAALWEPGYTEVAYLKVSNAGSLALKYHLAVSVFNETLGKTKTGADIILSDYLQFKVVESDTDLAGTYASREAAQAAPATATKLQNYNSEVKPLEAENEAGDNNYFDYVALIVYMPTTVGNEANHDGVNVPSIQMGVSLLATQQMAEEDSFGNDYDKGAAWDGVVPAAKPDTLVVDTDAKLISINSPEAFAYLDTLLNDGNFTTNYGAKWQYSVELNCDINLLGKEWTPIRLSNVVAFDGKGHTISNLKVTSGKDNAGLFSVLATNDLGYGAIKNLTIDGAYVKGGNNSGVLVGSSAGTLENVTVLNATIEANKYVGGLAGRTGNVNNCTVKDSTVVASNKTVGGLVGYCIGDPGIGSAIGNTVDNVTVTGTWNVGGAFGQAQNVNVDGNTVKNVTVTSTIALPADADANEVRTAEVAARSAFANTTIGTNTVENVNLVNQ